MLRGLIWSLCLTVLQGPERRCCVVERPFYGLSEPFETDDCANVSSRALLGSGGMRWVVPEEMCRNETGLADAAAEEAEEEEEDYEFVLYHEE